MADVVARLACEPEVVVEFDEVAVVVVVVVVVAEVEATVVEEK